MQKEIEKLRELQKRILYTRDNKEKLFLLRDFYHFHSFLEIIGKNPSSDITILPSYADFFDNQCSKEQQKSISILQERMIDLKEISKDIINFYHQYNFYSYTNSKYSWVDYRIMNNIMGDFFWNIGDDVLKLYNQMLSEQRIYKYYLEGFEGGAINTMYTDLAYIVLNHSEDNFNLYADLVHELGHTYHWFLELNKNLYIYDVHIFSEVISMTFEKLFMLYLEKNKLLSDVNMRRQSDYHSSLLNRYTVCTCIGYLNEKKRLKKNIGIDYEIECLINRETLKKLLEKECGMVYDSSLELSLLNFIYVIGDIISSYFYYQIQNNYSQGIEELKMFARSDNLSSANEIFQRYLSDLTYQKQYIKEYMQKRKNG